MDRPTYSRRDGMDRRRHEEGNSDMRDGRFLHATAEPGSEWIEMDHPRHYHRAEGIGIAGGMVNLGRQLPQRIIRHAGNLRLPPCNRKLLRGGDVRAH